MIIDTTMNIKTKFRYDFDLNKILSVKFEIPSCRRSIKIENKRYFLSFPKIIFNLFVDELYIKASIGYKIGNNIYLCNLPNTDCSYICLNNLSLNMFKQFRRKTIDQINVDLLVSNFLNYFWSSDFNFETCKNSNSYRKKIKVKHKSFEDELFDYYKLWNEKTLKRINFTLKKKDLIFLCSTKNFDQKSEEDNEMQLIEEEKRIKTDKDSYNEFYENICFQFNDEEIKYLWQKTNLDYKDLWNLINI